MSYIGRGATADGCQRVAQEYLCPCLKVFRKYSYVSVMYRLSYTQVAGKTAQRYDKISGYIITSPPLQGAKVGRAGEDKTTGKGLQSLTAPRCTLFAGTPYAPKSSALQAFTGCFIGFVLFGCYLIRWF